MVKECLDGLAVRTNGLYVDATYGGGGHSAAIAKRLGGDGRLFSFDQDADALANKPTDKHIKLIHANFRHIKAFLRMEGVSVVSGILADLGVSSHQIDEAERGFSTRLDGELDMRMDRNMELTAKDVVNGYGEGELANLLRLYGELPNPVQIAKSICDARKKNVISTTSDLRNAVARHLPKGFENKYLAMLFQAVRIEVNGELDALKALLEQAVELLEPCGRLVVISYHSLEDRLVKNFFKAGNFDGELKKDFYGNPIVPLKVVNRKVITPSEIELIENNRSRSAKLRVAEKI